MDTRTNNWHESCKIKYNSCCCCGQLNGLLYTPQGLYCKRCVPKNVTNEDYMPYKCSECETTEHIRHTPSGVFCRRCYLNLPLCAQCGEEPVIWLTDRHTHLTICRNCWQLGMDSTFKISRQKAINSLIYPDFDVPKARLAVPDRPKPIVVAPTKPCYLSRGVMVHVYSYAGGRCACGACVSGPVKTLS